MRFSTTTTASGGVGKLLLIWFLLSSFLGGTFALPFVRNVDIKDDDVSIVTTQTTRLPLQKNFDYEKRATPLIPKPKPGAKPGSPDASSPPPHKPGHNNAPETNLPPALTPDTKNPVRPESPTAKDSHSGSKDPPVNPGPKPDPKGPIPSEAEIAENYHVPPDKAIFWSQTKEDAYKYRDENGLFTDTTAYPPGYTEVFGKGFENAKYNAFARRFSIVYAHEAKGEVRIMVPWDTGPIPDRTFHVAEWPIIKEGLASGRITKVIQVNPNNFAETRIYDPTIYGLTRRSFDIDLNNIPWDINLDALAEAWKRANNEAT